MAMDSVNNLGTRHHLLNHIAYWMHKKDFARIDPTDQGFILDVFEFALDRVAGDADWMNMRKEAGFSTGISSVGTGTPTFSSITGAISLGSTAFSDGNATFQASGVRPGDLIISAKTEIAYRIASVVSEAGLVLDQPWAEATLSDLAYTIARDTYALAPDCWWLRSMQDMEDGTQILIMSHQDFIVRSDNREILGRPEIAVMLDSTAGVSVTSAGLPTPAQTLGVETVGQRVKLYYAPDSIRPIRYQYLALPNAISQNSQFQPHMVQLLVHATMVDVWQQRDEGNKSAFHEGKYQRLLGMFRKRDQSRSQTPFSQMRRQWVPGVRDGTGYVARGPEIVSE